MKVILAKSAGFCMGVRRAVETTLDMVDRKEGNIATLGPLIHNPQVLEMLQEKGVEVLEDVPGKYSGTVVIRAHGVPPILIKNLQESGADVEDATCPRVLKVQAIISKYKRQGYATVIIGDRDHAEVIGLMGYTEDTGVIVSNEEDVDTLRLPFAAPYIIVSQTTQDQNTFDRLIQMITDRFPNGKVFNTICDSTRKRQDEVRSLCGSVQALVVVGGRNSANTQRLGEIARDMGRPVYVIETKDELDLADFARYDCVGVTAGASTPTWAIEGIVEALKSVSKKNEQSQSG